MQTDTDHDSKDADAGHDLRRDTAGEGATPQQTARSAEEEDGQKPRDEGFICEYCPVPVGQRSRDGYIQHVLKYHRPVVERALGNDPVADNIVHFEEREVYAVLTISERSQANRKVHFDEQCRQIANNETYVEIADHAPKGMLCAMCCEIGGGD